MVDLGVQLYVGGESAPEGRARAREQTQGKLALEHENCTSEQGSVREKLEDEWRGNLVRRIGDTHVKVGKVGLAKVSEDDVKFALFRPDKEEQHKPGQHGKLRLSNICVATTRFCWHAGVA